ncbi:MAG: MBL fold metallo-hydrolase, partial [Clostridia bacterium]|nr:MBL fold metallo-hydrolase [Clostridia bacterium]
MLDVSRRVLISGDPIQEHGHIYMFGERRNLKDYVSSLEKLEERIPEFDEIWPSHSDIPLHPDCIRRLRDGAEQIVNR